MSKDELSYARLIKILSMYRLTLGQARQEELLEYILRERKDLDELKKLFIDLGPFSKKPNGQDVAPVALNFRHCIIDFKRIHKNHRFRHENSGFSNFLTKNGASKNGAGVSSGVSCPKGKNPKPRKSNFLPFIIF